MNITILENKPEALPGVSTHPKVLLRARNLHKSFGENNILNNVSFDLHEGEVILLRGANGSGKTTLLNILTGCLEPDLGRIETCMNGGESFNFPRHWWQKLNPKDHFLPEKMAQKGAGRAWQDIRLFGSQSLLNNITFAIQRQIGENPVAALLNRIGVRKQESVNFGQARAQLVRLGLADREKSSGDAVSLGQAKRVAIARAITAGAKILFLDEPLSGLDGKGASEIIDYIRSLVSGKRLTVVIVEHVLNIPRIIEFVNKIWTLAEGRLCIESSEAVKNIMVSTQIKTGLDVWIDSVVGKTGNKIVSEQGGARITRIVPDGVTPGDPLLEIHDVCTCRGKRIVFGKTDDETKDPFSLILRRGEWVVLQAPNGWGKTTLCHAIMGLVPINEGVIRFGGQLINNLSPWDRFRLGLRLVNTQNYLFPSLTIGECEKISSYNDAKRTHPLFRNSKRLISSLSGGEKKRVHLELLLSCQASLVILDEPIGSLDSKNINLLQKDLSAYNGESIMITEPIGAEDGNRK